MSNRPVLGRSKRVSHDALFRVGGLLSDRLLILFLVGSVGLFTLYPMIRIFLRSLQGEASRYGLASYFEVWAQYRGSLWNSIVVGVLSALICTALSLGTALAVTSARGRLKSAAMAVLLIAMVSPPFVSSLAYIQLYGRRGWITYRLLGLSLDPYNAVGVILMQALSFAPLTALFLTGLLSKVDSNALRSARDLGARPGDVLKDIVLPLVRPGILVSLLLCFVRSLADFGTPVIIGGRFSTLAADIYLQFTGYSNLEKASAMNMFLLVPSILAFFFYRRLMRRSDEQTQISRVRQEVPELSLTRCGPLGHLALGSAGLFFLMMILQYAAVFLSGFLKSTREGYVLTGEYLARMLRLDASVLMRSVFYALIVSLAGTFFAMLFAWYMDRRRIPGRDLIDSLATLPYMVPGISFGIAYILAFNQEPLKLTGSALIILANMIFKQLPTATKICSAALTQIPAAMERAAQDLGAGRLAVVRDVILPSLRPAFFSCFAYNFSSSMTTAGAILFLITPSRKLAVFRLFDAVSSGEYAVASLIASLIIVIVLLTEGLAYLFSKKEMISHVSAIGPSV